MTNNMRCRLHEHKLKLVAGLTAPYNVNRLGYAEHCSDVTAAIAREKQVDGWARVRKVAPIEGASRNRKGLSAARE